MEANVLSSIIRCFIFGKACQNQKLLCRKRAQACPIWTIKSQQGKEHVLPHSLTTRDNSYFCGERHLWVQIEQKDTVEDGLLHQPLTIKQVCTVQAHKNVPVITYMKYGVSGGNGKVTLKVQTWIRILFLQNINYHHQHQHHYPQVIRIRTALQKCWFSDDMRGKLWPAMSHNVIFLWPLSRPGIGKKW